MRHTVITIALTVATVLLSTDRSIGGNRNRAKSIALPEWENDTLVRAFPGAEGGGMFTSGGRGGRVIHVTNLNDSGEGSLREAVRKKGARTVVFDVAGTIELCSELKINNDDLTIAGQSAPGEGIALRNYPVKVSADNVIIRYLRFRMGDSAGVEDDALGGRGCTNVIIDHCSMSWSTDECASFYANRNFTMQWCIVSESLRNSQHHKGKHGYGGIWGGRDASFHHNLLFAHDSRNPRLDHPAIYGGDHPAELFRGAVDVRNNVISNWGMTSSYGGEDGTFNIVGNYYQPGTASDDKSPYFFQAYNQSNNRQYSYAKLYVDANYYNSPDAATINRDNRQGVVFRNSLPVGDELLDNPLPIEVGGVPAPITTHTALEAFERVLSVAGASLRRDAVDNRAVNDTATATATITDGGHSSTGGLIDTPAAAGGYPDYAATDQELKAATDSDGDGMPDWWERRFRLDAADPADGNAITLDQSGRYTNLEIYLASIVGQITLRQHGTGDYRPIANSR